MIYRQFIESHIIYIWPFHLKWSWTRPGGQSKYEMLRAFRSGASRGIVGSGAWSTVRLLNLSAFKHKDKLLRGNINSGAFERKSSFELCGIYTEQVFALRSAVPTFGEKHL